MNVQDNALHKIPLILMQGSWRSPMQDVQRYVKKGIDIFYESNIEKNNKKHCKIEEGNADNDLNALLLHRERSTHENIYNLFLNSSSTLVYSVFEHALLSIIQTIKIITKKNITIDRHKKNEKPNSIIDTYINALTKQYKINWSKLNDSWVKINNFRFIRNKIAHDGGELNEQDNSIFNEISKMELGVSRRGNIIMLSDRYLLDIIKTMMCFFEELCLELKEHVLLQ